MHYTKKGPGDLWSDDYKEVEEADYGECEICNETISYEQMMATKHLLDGPESYVHHEKHDFDPTKDWWVEIPYGLCEDCLKEIQGEEG